MKQRKRAVIDEHTKPSNVKALIQVFTTIAPLIALWYAAVLSTAVSYWLTAVVTLVMSFFLLRVFVLMHDCGHGSMFRGPHLNRSFGFIFGVLSGMPQYVWSEHHAYHHRTNGNWNKYRGPLAIVTTDDFERMTGKQRRKYQRQRNIWLAPIAGFFYLLFNPRINWIKGNIGLLRYIVKQKTGQRNKTLKSCVAEFKTPYWNSVQEYRHMSWNNIVLLSSWTLLAWLIGPALFFVVYVISMSLSGGGGILLFTVQHNFEHSYASSDAGWDYDVAAIMGTSFLVLPAWLNWFTANIAYHHVHHLSAAIPNYCLAKCHQQYQDLFTDVTRVTLSQVPHALKYILWDTYERRIISVAEFEQLKYTATAPQAQAV